MLGPDGNMAITPKVQPTLGIPTESLPEEAASAQKVKKQKPKNEASTRVKRASRAVDKSSMG